MPPVAAPKPNKPTLADLRKKEAARLRASFTQRALVLDKPAQALTAVSLALLLQNKNLFNTVHFAVQNVLTAYERVEPAAPSDAAPALVAAADSDTIFDAEAASTKPAALWRLKQDLHEHQKVAIARFNVAIDALNAARQYKYDLLQMYAHESEDDAEKAFEAELVLIPRLEATVTSAMRAALDLTLLDNVMRDWPGLDGTSVYSRLPAKAAQAVLRKYLACWSGYFAALKAYQAGGSAMTGHPRPPDYLAKKGQLVLELPLTQMGPNLIGLGARSIPLDFEESMSLTEDQLDAWNSYGIQDAVARACAKRGFPENHTPQQLRIVPHKSGVRFEVVVRIPRSLPEDSLLARLEKSLGDTLLDAGRQRNEVLIAALNQLGYLLPMCGVDLGVVNTLALAFSTGARGQVVSAGRLEDFLKRIDAKLDTYVGQLTSPELRELQGRKTALQQLEPPQKLPRADEMKLRKGLKELYADPHYRNLRSQRERWLADYLHKLSHDVVAQCLKHGVQVLVIGKNTGWKDGMNMGRRENRRFGNVPLARLIEQMRYKGEALGLVVITTEESYTSKTSFVNNEELRVFSKENRPPKQPKTPKKDKKAKSSGVEAAATLPTEVASPSLPCGEAALTSEGTTVPTSPAAVHAPQGKRLKGKRRTFVNYHQTGRKERVHSDINGAFNILRKAFKDFQYHEGLSLSYTLMRLSPRFGLTPIKLTPVKI